MWILLQVFAIFTTTICVALGATPSAGHCGTTSVPNVPGCWGQPGCAYVIATDLGAGAACKYDYCNCGGTNVPLLPETLSGTTTVGCASWTTQPSSNHCPTASPTIPRNSANSLQTSLPKGGTVVTGQVDGTTTIETFIPTTYSQFTTVTKKITTTIVIKSSTETVVVGPSGIGWTPFDHSSNEPNLPAPSVLPQGADASSKTSQATTRSGHASRKTSQATTYAGQTIITSKVGSVTITETFVPTTLSKFSTLTTTLTTTTTNAQSSTETMIIGPGGVAWTLLGTLASGVPELPAPSILPKNPKNPTVTSTAGPGSSQSSITGAFAISTQSETTIVAGGKTLHYTKETIQSLLSITAPTTITTPIPQTNKDGSKFTISAAVIIVGKGGVWWYGGTGGFGLSGPSCIWPFCPPGGGGDSGGSGSGKNPNDPDTPGSKEDPSDPDEEDDNKSKTLTSTEKTSTEKKSTESACTRTSIVSDCSNLCSTPTGASTLKCSMTCYSTQKGCGVTGTTVKSTVSATATGSQCVGPKPPGSTKPRRDYIDKVLGSSSYPLKKRILKTPEFYGDNSDRVLVQPALEPLDINITKRTLPKPQDPPWNGDNGAFLVAEYGRAIVMNNNGNSGVATVAGDDWVFFNYAFNIGVGDMFGCTAIIVASYTGVWIAHIWEIFGFRQAPFVEPPPARTPANVQYFQQHVLNAIRNGANVGGAVDVAGLQGLTGQHGPFTADQKPIAVIVTPSDATGSQSAYKYTPEVQELQNLLAQLFPGATTVTKTYIPNMAQANNQANNPNGKLLLQYDPFEAMVQDPNNACNVLQQCTFRIWFESQPLWLWQRQWAANAVQAIPNFAGNAGAAGGGGGGAKAKRAGSDQCALPSSLIQASFQKPAAGDHLPSSVPDYPSSTIWAHIGSTSPTGTGHKATTSQTGTGHKATTSPTKTGHKSTITSAPGPKPTCMADGAPWMSPTSYCDCGASAHYPTLPPKSGVTTANCDYTTLPKSTIKPVSTGTAPTNKPGTGGVPGCALEIASEQGLPPGSHNFCDCGGVTAPVLVTTTAGTASSNCDYSTQPTAGYNPIPPSDRTTTTTPSKTAEPTIGTFVCHNNQGCLADVQAGHVDTTSSYFETTELPNGNMTSQSGNVTQVFHPGQVIYVMNVGWIPGCSDFESQDPGGTYQRSNGWSIDSGTILTQCYSNCTANAGYGGYIDVGCLRFGFYPNKISGVADSPPKMQNLWGQYPDLC